MVAPTDLYGWFPQQLDAKRWTTPEQAPNSISATPTGVLSPSAVAQGWQPGALSQLAYGLAGSPRQLPPGALPGGSSGAPLPAYPGGGSSDPTENNKAKGALGGAAAGFQAAGPWGALVGGVLGYGAGGGAKDLNPIDASGFSGISMDQARADQNLARLGSNPGAAIASYAGIKSNSDIGRALDPTSFLGGLFRSKHGDEKRNLSAFTQKYPLTDAGNGMYALPDGTKINGAQLKDLAGTWYGATYAPDGDQAGWQDKYNEVLQGIYSQPMYFGG